MKNFICSISCAALAALVFTCATIFAFNSVNSFYPIYESMDMKQWGQDEWYIADGIYAALLVLFYRK